ncbi:uncharacterized protein LOC135169382 [Diachasmimorpha longicaudata]|uniref:uncharacterized protein LOC135169382 n=1 Tax=Diachasmimorpha longicaudata TaxID=58733 RepID=UPI0030B8F982
MCSHKLLLEFLEVRGTCSSAIPPPMAPITRSERPRNLKNQVKPKAQVFVTTSKRNCGICSGEHRVMNCEEFLKMPVPKREKTATNLSLCFNCLSRGHGTKECLSTFKCKRCNKSHHTLLHHDKPGSYSSSMTSTQASTAAASSNTSTLTA